MRRGLGLVLALVALVAPGSRAIATALVCASPCEIQTQSHAYILPVEVIPSGAEVKWVSADAASHPTSDVPIDQDPCYVAHVGPYVAPDSIRFDIAGGGVLATEDSVTKACASALALPNGYFVVPYHCNIHPWMVGRLLIHP